jgi:hypothetical protein
VTAPPRGRLRRVWVPLAVVALLAAALAAYLLVRGGDAAGRDSMPAPGGEVTSSELTGEWSGEGMLVDCAGLDDEDCSGTRSITLSIECSAVLCEVTPFDSSYGSPPLRFEDGRYRAVGPVPPELAPTCGGSPTRSAQWRLELVAGGGRLGGTYAESTIQGFDCGATFLAWEVVLARR